ncbi:MAG: hypothetical protein ACTS8R_04870 [Arsenophonus sp. NC-QC1-MAG3]
MNNSIKLAFVFGITAMTTSFANTVIPTTLLTTQKLPQLQQGRLHAIISDRVVNSVVGITVFANEVVIAVMPNTKASLIELFML